jgi:triose/dihydroxyacetone kinase / FAD-AMP lyase (cyclizing)
MLADRWSRGSLDEVTRAAKLTAAQLLSVGSAISHVKKPNQPIQDKQSDELLATERFGSEPGSGEHQLLGSRKLEVDLPGIVETMLQELLDWSDEDRSFSTISAGDELVLLVNNLGGLSGLELGAITLEIAVQLEKKYGTRPVRVYSGTFMSTLNELGFSISLLKVVDLGLANRLSMVELLDAPAETTAWPATIDSSVWKRSKPVTSQEDQSTDIFASRTGLPELDPELPRKV